MAQYFWSAEDQTAGDGLSATPFITPISTFTGSSTATVRNAEYLTWGNAQKALFLETYQANFWQLLYSINGTTALAAGNNVEVYVDYYTPVTNSTSNTNHRLKCVALAGGTTGTDIDQVYGGAHWDKRTAISQYDSGTFTERASEGTTTTTARRVVLLFKLNGTDAKLKYAAKTTDMGTAPDLPAGWTLETTHTHPETDGGVGLFLRGTGGNNYTRRFIYAVGIGTGGDAAPTEPVTVGAPTLSAVSAESRTSSSIVPRVTVTF